MWRPCGEGGVEYIHAKCQTPQLRCLLLVVLVVFCCAAVVCLAVLFLLLLFALRCRCCCCRLLLLFFAVVGGLVVLSSPSLFMLECVLNDCLRVVSLLERAERLPPQGFLVVIIVVVIRVC